MIQWFDPYGWYIQLVCLMLMLVAVGIAAGVVITAETERSVTVLESKQAIERGWPAEWGK